MLCSNHLIGFGAGSAPLVTTIIPFGTGTVIGDNNSTWQTRGNAFDGNVSQTGAASAAPNGNGSAPSGFVNWVGKDWNGVGGGTKIITKYDIIAPNNVGFTGGGSNPATAFRLYGSNTASPDLNTVLTSWTLLDSVTSAGGVGETVTRTSATIDISTAYRSHIIVGQGNGTNSLDICEVRFYEDI